MLGAKASTVVHHRVSKSASASHVHALHKEIRKKIQ